MASRWSRNSEVKVEGTILPVSSERKNDVTAVHILAGDCPTDETVALGRWRRSITDGQRIGSNLSMEATSQHALDNSFLPMNSASASDSTLTHRCEGVSAMHQDPKTGDIMEGPGISEWGLGFLVDGKEGRHRDPWSLSTSEISKSWHGQATSEKPRGRKVPAVRQGQGIEEALSKIGADAGVRQERPRTEGYCPAGESDFRASEFHFPSSDCHRKGEMGVAKEMLTAAQRRNQRHARRRVKHQETGSCLVGEEVGCVVLVRDDCRLHDNPALYTATQTFTWVLALYVHDTCDPSPLPVRGAGLYWRHMSLMNFENALKKCNGRLVTRKGVYIEEVLDVLLSSGATAVYFNRQLEPWYHQRDLDIARQVSQMGFQAKSFKGLVLQREPWDVEAARPPPHLLTKYQGAPSKVSDEKDDTDDPYFWPLHAFSAENSIDAPLPSANDFGKNLLAVTHSVESLSVASLGYGLSAGKGMPPSGSMRQYNETRELLLHDGGLKRDTVNDWAFEMRKFWRFGEEGALAQLESFLVEAAAGHYQPPERYRADKPWTALLSPYLRFGDLSPRFVYARAKEVLSFTQWKPLVRRLFWRDGAYAQLYRWPSSPDISIRKQYESEQWNGTHVMLQRWQRGQTGFPLIDAAMRQLWKVGWMPNYLRHVTAQFLIEYLDVSWKCGLQWYDYTLVDSDVAINAMMWQMGGHSGLGAWNFVMHPVFAGKKVDPEGQYVRRWLPELRGLPVEYIHCPWESPCALLLSANVILASTYHERIFEDLVKARKAHARNVIAVRRSFPELVQEDGHEILEIAGQQLVVRVRDDLKDNSENITLEMTPDDAHSAQRRRLTHTKGIHNAIIFDETQRYESQSML